MKATFKTYYSLTKPGIIYGNIFTAIAGFFLASRGSVDFVLLLATLFGIAFVIGSACVVNNYIDRGIDDKMARTKKRALVTGSVSPRSALTYAAILGVLGFASLIIFTNPLTVVIGLIGFIDYIVFYGFAKRRSTFGTLVGSISGAMPPVAGYTAVTGRFDGAALILFLILVCWQMGHFFAIAIYRLKDYKAASIPLLPVVKGVKTTKLHMLFYIAAFTLIAPLLTVYGYASRVYFIISLLTGLVWLTFCVKGFWSSDDTRWARQTFLLSLVVLTVISCTIILDSFFV